MTKIYIIAETFRLKKSGKVLVTPLIAFTNKDEAIKMIDKLKKKNSDKEFSIQEINLFTRNH